MNSPSRITPLKAGELAQIATDLQAMVGSQFQDVSQTLDGVGLAFYHGSQVVWLWADLDPRAPVVVRFFGKGKNLGTGKRVVRPLSLFAKSRLLGRRLASVHVDLSRGRVLVLGFHRAPDEEERGACEIEIHLYPSGQNVIARDGVKTVAENKPREMKPNTDFIVESGRTWEEIEESWKSQKTSRPAQREGAVAAPDRTEREWRKLLEKKEKALAKMREDLFAKSATVFRDAGEWLKSQGKMPASEEEIPTSFVSVFNLDLGFSENLEILFRRAKDGERKREGSRERIATIERELTELRAAGPEGFAKIRDAAASRGKANLLAHANARGRKLSIGEDLEAYIGKSAGDNMALLRRAQPFDYWLHPRDQPGAHAILRRHRGRVVTNQEFLEAGRWVIEQTLGRRAADLVGEKHDLLIVECRFVRPIKGEKLGRVHYTNERTMGVFWGK